MINKLHIERFMDIVDETLDLKPLTVITGVNSAGKSAVIQAVLAVLKKANVDGGFLLRQYDYGFNSAVCKYDAYSDFKIHLTTDDQTVELSVNVEEEELNPKETTIGLEKNVFYLSANRKGYDIVELKAENYSVGVQGEYLFGILYKDKDAPIALELPTDDAQRTLGSHVDYWLKEMLGMKFKVNTEEKNSNIIVSYDTDELRGLTPNKLGTAVSYLAKVLIMCLRAKRGDVLMIENPEIHLHPKAQAKLGEFLTIIANAGVQLIVETHSEHVINKIQYQIYSGKFDTEELAIYYKSNPHEKFEKVVIDENGRYSVDFPEGFFDASLDDLMAIG